MQENALDGLDRAVLHALQIRPRASWTELGRVLDVDPATVGRRWVRLHRTGSAWTTCYPGGRLMGSVCLAFVEIDVHAGRAVEVGRTLATYPQVVTVEQMAGGRDLFTTVMIRDLGALSELVTEHIAALPGVLRTRAQLSTRVFTEGSRWRLRALTPAQRSRLAPPAADRASGALDDHDLRLVTALSADCRRAAVDLADEVGLSPPNVRRRVAALAHAGDAAMRCEIARDLTGWPISASLWASVPPGQLDKVVAGLGALPELRMCSTVTGPHNLLFTVWLKSVADVGRLEALLGERLPQLRLVDRAVALRQIKLMGRMLDEHGRAGEAVPIDPWTGPPR